MKDFSGALHEIRNQLAVARASLEAFIDGKLAPTAERLQAVAQALAQLEALLNDLRGAQTVDQSGPPQSSLDVKSAAPQTTPRRINVCVLLAAEFRALEALAAQKRIAMSVTQCAHRSKACEEFLGDPVRIGQIVKNVLLNAVRYTPAGGTIAVDCSRAADEVQVTITDTGPGVSAEDAHRIFETGYRGEAAAGTSGEGHGLAIVKRLVEEQGGRVTLASDFGHGASFTIRLPGMPDAFASAT